MKFASVLDSKWTSDEFCSFAALFDCLEQLLREDSGTVIHMIMRRWVTMGNAVDSRLEQHFSCVRINEMKDQDLIRSTLGIIDIRIILSATYPLRGVQRSLIVETDVDYVESLRR